MEFLSDPNGPVDSSEAVISLGSATKKFTVGTTYVRYVAIDAAGLADTCTFDVTVIDNEAPQALCQDITVYLDENGQVTIDSDAVDNGSSDNCEIASFSTDITNFDCSNVFAPVTVTMTVADAAGNSFDCWADVTVIDSIKPTIECPADTTLFTTDGPISPSRAVGDCSFLIEGTTFDAVYNDNCPVTVYLDINDGNGFQEESTLDGFLLENADTTYTFTWRVVDESGNSAECTFNITLEDDENPEFTYCPDDINEFTVDTDCNQNAKWHPPVMSDITDNCGVLSMTGPFSDDPDLVFILNDPDTTFALFKEGETQVWYIAEDVNGNFDTCSFTVTVTDNDPPVIVSCAPDVDYTLNSDCNPPVLTLGDYRADVQYDENCEATVTQTPAPGTDWATILGDNPNDGDSVQVTLVVDDGTNATASCSFFVIFHDLDDPSITCPADQTVYVDASCNYDIDDFTGMAVTTDNCGVVTVTQSPTGTSYSAGDNIVVTLTADDGHGNSASCTFNVAVEDNMAPAFAGVADTMLNLGPGECNTI
ncbi:MAG: HYR domain-containing protein, partial [Bacteroidota bacterium]